MILFLALLLALGLASQAEAQVAFEVPANSPFQAAIGPESVAIGDLNGDGQLDLATANRNVNNVSVLLGDGTGSFGMPTNFQVGSGPRSVALGDLDGDGDLDLAVANRLASNVSTLLGDGTGSFAPQANSPFMVGNDPRSVALGDLDGDGNLDLVTANSGSNTVSILLGDGTGSFAPQANSPFPVGAAPESVAIGDLNGDGQLDLATANRNVNNVSVLLGDGTGSFVPEANSPFQVGTSPESVAIGDLNGDGQPDLAVANRNGNNVSVLLGDGTGSFGMQTTFTTGARPSFVAIGDLDGDGNPDLAVTNATEHTVSVLINSTAPGAMTPIFAAKTDSITGTGPESVAIDDIDGDGDLDIAVANFGSNNVSVFLVTGTFVRTDFPVGAAPESVATGDLDGNGNLDLAVANRNNNNVSVLLGDGTGSFAPQANSPFPVGAAPESVATGDLDGDGNLDLVTANATSNNVSVLLGDGTGSFAPQANSPFTTGTAPSSVAIGDLDGNGNLDLAVANTNDNNVSVLVADGMGGFAQTDFPVGASPRSVAIGDLDGDGNLDLAVANRSDNNVSVLLGDGTGSFAPQANSPFAVEAGPASVAIGDLDGNGNLDLAVANTNDNNVSVLLGDGTGSFAPQANSPFTTGTAPSSVAIGDLNGVGNLDLAVTNATDNTVSVLLATGSFTRTDFATGAAPEFVAIADLNGDGQIDLVIANFDIDTVSAFINTLNTGAPGGGEGGSGVGVEDDDCFIATAAYGSPLAPQVQLLRELRDRYLLPFATGRAFVKIYYSVSPPLAELIAGSEILRTIVRAGLVPIIGWAALVLWSPSLGLGIPIVALGLGVWLTRRKWAVYRRART
jgi:hypothetical protein